MIVLTFGNASLASGYAGINRSYTFDTNIGTDWTQSSTSATLTLGTFNSGYWPPLMPSDADYLSFKLIIRSMGCAKVNSICPLGVDVYIEWPSLNGSNAGQFTDQNEINWIDQHVDRTYLHIYRCNPLTMYSIGGPRFQLFGTNSFPNSVIYPIFSAEATVLQTALYPDLIRGDFLGYFLTDNSVSYNPNGGYTTACAETKFQVDYDAAATSWDNNIEGYAWFTYNVLNNNASYPLFRKAN
jgi:hypothetical protein